MSKLQAAGGNLPPKLRQAGLYLAHHPQEAILLPLRDLAERAQVAPATLVRLVTALEYENFDALRRACLESLDEGSPGYSQKARVLSHRADTGMDLSQRLLASSNENAMQGLGRTADRNAATAMERFARKCLNARRLYFLGQRSCYPLAYSAAYLERLLRDDVELLSDDGGALGDGLWQAGPEDALFIVSQAPYSRVVVELARHAHANGLPLLVITDEPSAPYCNWTAEVLFFDTQSVSFFPTQVGAMMLIEQLMMLQVALSEATVVEHITAREAALQAANAYWSAGVKRDAD